MIQIADLPAVNATLNAIAATLLICGYTMIRRGRVTAHRRFMLSAFATSILFLICYVIYHANVGSKRFPGTDVLSRQKNLSPGVAIGMQNDSA